MEAKLRQVQSAPVEPLVKAWMREDQGSRQPALDSTVYHSPVVNQPTSEPKGSPIATASGQSRLSRERSSFQGQPEEIQNLLEEMESYLGTLNIQLSFSVHYETKEMVVQVIDSVTGDVIRQIPSREVLELKEKVNELRGMLFDQNA